MAQDNQQFEQQFKNPPASCRILKINHGWPGTAEARQAQVDALLRGGFGGYVTSVNFGSGYVNSADNWNAIKGGISATQKAGLDLWMYDEAGYPSGRAGGLVLEGHPEREAHGLFGSTVCSDIANIGLRNIAPSAKLSVSSTDPTNNLYAPKNLVNNSISPKDWQHWSNDPNVDSDLANQPAWILMEWPKMMPVTMVRMITKDDYAIQDYRIEYFDGAAWKQYSDANVKGNTLDTRVHKTGKAVMMSKLRMLGYKGPEKQRGIVRVVELQVFIASDQTDIFKLVVPPGELLFTKAYRMDKNGKIQLSGAVNLPKPVEGFINWQAPKGLWRLVAVSRDRLFDHTQVDFSGVPEHAPYVSLLDPDVVTSFLSINHDKFAQELGNDLGKYFVSTFTDEPSLIADYYDRSMPWAPIAWHKSLEEGYRKLSGRNLMTDLPFLFIDSPEQTKIRYNFWQATADQLSSNYFGRIRSWCKKHNVPSGGHLLLEEDIREHIPLYGDFFRCLRELDVPGIDLLNLDPTRTPWYTARMASSACELDDGQYVMSETSDFEEMMENPPRPVSVAQFRGTLNKLMLGGINRFNSYSQFRDMTDADLRALNEWTGRGCLALTGGVRNAQIGLLYPIHTAWTRFRPSTRGVDNAGELTNRLADIFMQSHRMLYDNCREYSLIDAQTIADAAVSNGVMSYKWINHSVIILPDVDTLPEAAWKNLEAFWSNGGVVIALGSIPQNSEREFPDASVKRLGSQLFGKASLQNKPSFAANAKRGMGVYLPAEKVSKLPAILDMVLERDITPSDTRTPVRMTRRAIDGHDVYFIINDSDKPWSGSVTINQPADSCMMCDLATGELKPMANPHRAELHLEAFGAVILRMNSITKAQRLYPASIKLS